MARTQFSAEVYDKKHRRSLARIQRRLEDIYKKMYEEAAKIGVSTHFSDPDKEFYLKDFPQAEKRVDALLHSVSADVYGTINDGNKEAWEMSCVKNAAMVSALASRHKLPKKQVKEWSQRNMAGLEAFQQRTVNGMNLSERVWDFVKHDKAKLEMALELGLAEGKGAAALSRDVRQYLEHPDKLFRRVRDKDGVLRLSKAAQAYHPGQGVYRSSYKNAFRLAATETNMAYRSADHDAWAGMPFVIGQTVKLSKMHSIRNTQGKKYPNGYYDMCDELAGDYPKDFKFTGWHPHCRCFVVAKLASDEEIDKYQSLSDEEQASYKWKDEVREMPKNYDEWMEKNAERIADAKSMPYFIKDNYVGGVVDGGLKFGQPAAQMSVAERAKIRHEARTPEEIADIQTRWNKHRIENEGEGYTLSLPSGGGSYFCM